MLTTGTGDRYLMADTPLFFWWGIPLDATDAVLQMPDHAHAPISLRFKLK